MTVKKRKKRKAQEITVLSFAIKEMVQLSEPWEYKSLNQGRWAMVENQAPSTREVSRLPNM